MEDVDKFIEQARRYDQACAEAAMQNKATLFSRLATTGITLVTVSFDGEGDDGQIEEVAAFAGDKAVELSSQTVTISRPAAYDDPSLQPKPVTLAEAIEDLCYIFLEQEHGGWEDGGGSYGTFTFDVTRSSITLEVNARFVDVTTSTYQL